MCTALTSTPRLLARTSSACPAMSLVSGLPCARIQGALPVAGPGARSAGIHRNVVTHARVPTNVHPCPGVRSWVRPADGRAGHHPVQGEQPNEERTQANKECYCQALPCHLPSCPPIVSPPPPSRASVLVQIGLSLGWVYLFMVSSWTIRITWKGATCWALPHSLPPGSLPPTSTKCRCCRALPLAAPSLRSTWRSCGRRPTPAVPSLAPSAVSFHAGWFEAQRFSGPRDHPPAQPVLNPSQPVHPYCSTCWSHAAGLVFGIIAWLVTCQALEGRITIDLLGGDYPMLAGVWWHGQCSCRDRLG